MKALKSKRAAKLFADPSAKEQLRQFLMNKHQVTNGAHGPTAGQFIVRLQNGDQLKLKVVPKATKAM